MLCIKLNVGGVHIACKIAGKLFQPGHVRPGLRSARSIHAKASGPKEDCISSSKSSSPQVLKLGQYPFMSGC